MSNSTRISLAEAVSIGIGGMVGGGIFAVLGLAVSLAKGGTPVAFGFAGVITLLTAYSYARMSTCFPDSGGTVAFINQGFGKGIFSGGTNNLLWVSYIIMLALYATAFGSYAAQLLPISGHEVADKHIYINGIILLAALINYFGTKIVGEIESYAVYIKLGILSLFVIVGLIGLRSSTHIHQLMPGHWENPLQLLTGGMVIFVAYEGFELIANAAPDIYPAKNIGRSYYIAVISVIVLYILIAVITVGSLSFPAISKAEDYVLAQAAQPMLGKTGFTIITIAALISTFSAINATIYGGSRVNYKLAEDDELPHELTKFCWNQPVGLLLTVALTLLMANSVNLESIAISGSAGFLFIFGLVNYTNYKLAVQTGSKKWISLFGAISCFIALLVLLVQQWQANRTGTLISIAIIAGCFTGEWIFKKTGRKQSTGEPA